MRIAAWPCHSVPPHQQVPSRCTSAMMRRVVSASPKETMTWFSVTSFSTANPALRKPSAKRAARGFRGILPGLAMLAHGKVGRADGHGRAQMFGVADDGETGIVRHVQPLVAVRGPGVGFGKSGDEMRALRRRGGPQAVGAVDVHPGAGFARPCTDFGGGIEGAGIDVAGLQAKEGAVVQVRQCVRTQAALTIDGNTDNAVAPHAKDPERLQQ